MALASWWGELRYFKPDEFSHPEKLDMRLMFKLELARKMAGVPFVPTSGWRSALHNLSVGGAERSSHLRGEAADIKCPDSHTKFIIVRAAMVAGFRRIGVYKSHVHLDVSLLLPQEVLWLA